MSEGWKCPVCGRGVAPTEKHCDHNNAFGGLWPLMQRGCIPTTCPCPPNIYCGNYVCPRRLITGGIAYSHGALPT